MIATDCDGSYSLKISIASGIVDFMVTINLSCQDFEVIERDDERAALLHAALHHPFQLKDTALNEVKQRNFLNKILHASKSDVEKFLTNMDHGTANGAISNMIRITCKKDQSLMRKGHWFN